MRLVPLTAEHQDAVLEFETVNRTYFAASITDRGDDFFADYPARHAALLAMQAAGTDRFHLVLTDDGSIAGRVNLMEVADGDAKVGYRVGRDYAGRGLATEAVRQVCHLARSAYGLTRLYAVASVDNHASQTVLLRNDFIIVGETTVADRAAHLFRRDTFRTTP